MYLLENYSYCLPHDDTAIKPEMTKVRFRAAITYFTQNFDMYKINCNDYKLQWLVCDDRL